MRRYGSLVSRLSYLRHEIPDTPKEKSMTSERDREIKRRRHRRDKVRKLRARLDRTTDVRQRAVVIRKIQRVSPAAPVPES